MKEQLEHCESCDGILRAGNLIDDPEINLLGGNIIVSEYAQSTMREGTVLLQGQRLTLSQ